MNMGVSDLSRMALGDYVRWSQDFIDQTYVLEDAQLWADEPMCPLRVTENVRYEEISYVELECVNDCGRHHNTKIYSTSYDSWWEATNEFPMEFCEHEDVFVNMWDDDDKDSNIIDIEKETSKAIDLIGELYERQRYLN